MCIVVPAAGAQPGLCTANSVKLDPEDVLPVLTRALLGECAQLHGVHHARLLRFSDCGSGDDILLSLFAWLR